MILKLIGRGKSYRIVTGVPSDIDCPYCRSKMEVLTRESDQSDRIYREYWCEECWALYTTSIQDTITVQNARKMVRDLEILDRTARVIIDEGGKYQIQMYVKSQMSASGYAWMDLAARFASNEINKAAELIACMRLWG